MKTRASRWSHFPARLGLAVAGAACLLSCTGGPGEGSSSTSSSSGAVASSSMSTSSGGVDGGMRDAGSFVESSISGQVQVPSGAFGVFDVLVWVDFTGSNGAMVHRQTHTREDGSFTLRNVAAGTHTLHALRGHLSGTAETTLPLDTSQVEGANIRVMASSVDFTVVTGSYDRIEDVVGDLGFTPRMVDGLPQFEPGSQMHWLDVVTTPDILANTNAIFLNCGLDDAIWMRSDLEEKRTALRAYVSGGRSLYISDWAYNVMEWLYPDAVDFSGEDTVRDEAKTGEAQTVAATMVDEAVVKLVGRQVQVTYDLSAWAVMAAVEATPASEVQVDVLARGTVQRFGAGDLEDVPLAVVVHHGAGRVIYTTFHNEAQLDPTVLSILRYMVLSL